MPTWCLAHGGFAAVKSSTGRSGGKCCHAAATSIPGWRWAFGCTTPLAAIACTDGPYSRRLTTAVASQGYCFQVDLAWRVVQAGCRVVEVPITFAERERGESKMSGSIVREALWRVTVWGAGHRTDQLRATWSRRRHKTSVPRGSS